MITRLNICSENIIRRERADIFALVRKDIGFVRILQIIIDHAPDRCISRSGNHRNNFNCVLSVENIIHSIPATYLYRIDLIDIKVFCRMENLLFGY